MDHARNKILFIILLLVCFTACTSRTPEEWLVKHIEDKYANLYVNNEQAKRAALAELKDYLKSHKLNDDNLIEIKKRLHKISDGHLVMFDDRKEKNIRYESGVKFVTGTNFINTCNECTPVVTADTWQIEEVNKLPLQSWLEQEKYNVAASTQWGREYRLVHLFKENSSNAPVELKLRSSKGKALTTTVAWKEMPLRNPTCATGERLNEHTYKLSVYNLWCEDLTKEGQTRTEIVDNFKSQVDLAMDGARADDKIVVDLRENGGGGDFEVEYILNLFFPKSVYMYHYKYLRKTEPGKRKHLEKLWPFKLNVWAPEEYQYTDIKDKPKKQFFDNKVVTLISAGCFSSCETIASTLKLEKRSPVIGLKTHGGSGDPVIFAIKGTSYSINVPTCVTWQENHEFFEGVGVAPTIGLTQSSKSNVDDVLKASIDLVQ